MKQNKRAKSRVVTVQPVQEFLPLGILDLHAQLRKELVKQETRRYTNTKTERNTRRTHRKTHTHSGHMNIEQHGRTNHNPVQESMLLFIKGGNKTLRCIKKKSSFVMRFTARQLSDVFIV